MHLILHIDSFFDRYLLNLCLDAPHGTPGTGTVAPWGTALCSAILCLPEVKLCSIIWCVVQREHIVEKHCDLFGFKYFQRFLSMQFIYSKSVWTFCAFYKDVLLFLNWDTALKKKNETKWQIFYLVPQGTVYVIIWVINPVKCCLNLETLNHTLKVSAQFYFFVRKGTWQRRPLQSSKSIDRWNLYSLKVWGADHTSKWQIRSPVQNRDNIPSVHKIQDHSLG